MMAAIVLQHHDPHTILNVKSSVKGKVGKVPHAQYLGAFQFLSGLSVWTFGSIGVQRMKSAEGPAQKHMNAASIIIDSDVLQNLIMEQVAGVSLDPAMTGKI
eukprot:538476-Pelagomonas_calceolata.AAC.1